MHRHRGTQGLSLDTDLAVFWGFLGAVLFVALWIWRGSRRRRLADTALMEGELTSDERRVMERVAPLCRFLTDGQRKRWEGAVRLFLARKTFIPCQGSRVDNDVRLSIAGQACLLLAGRPDLEVYPELTTIYLHPGSYVRRDDRSIGGGAIATDEEATFDGESWDHGAVVLSVRSVRASFRFLDGFNVVMHEFAHQLDAMAGGSDGCPPMPARLLPGWKVALDEHHRALGEADDRGEDPFLDPYGAESPVEFFAVAVESFFELGPQFESEHPKFYGMLREVFGLDPARW